MPAGNCKCFRKFFRIINNISIIIFKNYKRFPKKLQLVTSAFLPKYECSFFHSSHIPFEKNFPFSTLAFFIDTALKYCYSLGSFSHRVDRRALSVRGTGSCLLNEKPEGLRCGSRIPLLQNCSFYDMKGQSRFASPFVSANFY